MTQTLRTGLHAEELMAAARGESPEARSAQQQWSAVEQQKARISERIWHFLERILLFWRYIEVFSRLVMSGLDVSGSCKGGTDGFAHAAAELGEDQTGG